MSLSDILFKMRLGKCSHAQYEGKTIYCSTNNRDCKYAQEMVKMLGHDLEKDSKTKKFVCPYYRKNKTNQ